jgi:hypothetical protein
VSRAAENPCASSSKFWPWEFLDAPPKRTRLEIFPERRKNETQPK